MQAQFGLILNQQLSYILMSLYGQYISLATMSQLINLFLHEMKSVLAPDQKYLHIKGSRPQFSNKLASEFFRVTSDFVRKISATINLDCASSFASNLPNPRSHQQFTKHHHPYRSLPWFYSFSFGTSSSLRPAFPLSHCSQLLPCLQRFPPEPPSHLQLGPQSRP